MRWEEFLRTLGKDDLPSLASLAAFAWKCLDLPRDRAYDYALQALHNARHGSDDERRRAATLFASAELWCKDRGVEAVRWGLECVEAGSRG